MKNITFGILLFLFNFGALNIANAAPPVPYSEQALKDLNKSINKMGNFIPPVGSTKEEAINSLINYYSKVFSQAGYSFEKSIIQYSNDLDKDPDFLSKGLYSRTPAAIVSQLADQINEMRKDNNQKPSIDKFLIIKRV